MAAARLAYAHTPARARRAGVHDDERQGNPSQSTRQFTHERAPNLRPAMALAGLLRTGGLAFLAGPPTAPPPPPSQLDCQPAGSALSLTLVVAAAVGGDDEGARRRSPLCCGGLPRTSG